MGLIHLVKYKFSLSIIPWYLSLWYYSLDSESLDGHHTSSDGGRGDRCGSRKVEWDQEALAVMIVIGKYRKLESVHGWGVMGKNLVSHIHHLDAVKILPFHCNGEKGKWRF